MCSSDLAPGEACVAERFEHRPVQGVAAQMIGQLGVGAALEQCFHQRRVAGSGRRHQRCLVHRRAMVDAVALALLKNLLEARLEIRQIVLAPEARALRLEVACGVEADFREQFATLTLGSGAAAMLLSRAELCPDGHRFVGVVNRAATQHNQLCRGQADRMTTDAKTLLFAGLELAAETWQEARQTLGWEAAQLDEQLFFDVFAPPPAERPRTRPGRAR